MKKKRILLHTLMLCAISILAVPSFLGADVYLKYKQHTDPFEVAGQVQPASDSVRETWVGKNKIRNDEGAQTVIMRLDKKLVYFIDNRKKTYSELPMDVQKMAEKAIEQDKSMTPQEKQEALDFVEGMMKSMSDLSITVEETAETKKIGSWKCRKYVQTTSTSMGPSVTEVWATRDIDLDYDLLNRMYAASMMMMPGLRDSIDEITGEMKKIKGIAVYSASVTSAMDTRIKSSQQLLDYADKDAPQGLYEPPADYMKHEM